MQELTILESRGSVTTDGGFGSFGGFRVVSSVSSSSSSMPTSSGDGDLFGVVCLLVMLYVFRKTGNDGKVEPENDEKAIEVIKLVHPDFEEYDFISYTKELYLELQNMQLKEYIDNHIANHLDRVCVDRAVIKSFKRSDDHDVIKVILSSYMYDDIRNDGTGELIQGDSTAHLYTVYNMEFIYEEDDVSDSNPY